MASISRLLYDARKQGDRDLIRKAYRDREIRRIRGGAGTPGYGGGSIASLMAQYNQASQANNSKIDSLMNEYRNNYNSAKQANLERYNEILGDYEARETESRGLLENAGVQRKSDLEEEYRNQEASARQHLTSRGLSGTTALSTMKMGIGRERQSSLNRLQERLNQEKLGVVADQTKQKIDFKERREDEYPDMNAYVALAGAYGKSQPDPSLLASAMQGGGGGAKKGSYSYSSFIPYRGRV